MDSIQDFRTAQQHIQDKLNVISDQRAIDALIYDSNALDARCEVFRQQEIERMKNEEFLKRLQRDTWWNRLRIWMMKREGK